MQESLLDIFRQYPGLAVIISLALSVVVAIVGLLPSVFITAANILFFGFWPGTLLSFVGEALGAGIAFLLYRRGFQRSSRKALGRFPRLQQLVEAEGRTAFSLVFALRLLPFVPSGLVTLAAAVGRMSLPLFLLASSIGKIPALLIEAYAVQAVTDFGVEGKIVLGLVAGGILFWVIKKGSFGKKEH